MRRRGPYRLARRADRMAETRRRITGAAVQLHQELGPLATSVAAIADRAGVGRPTVYAHFPDEETLFAACTAHYFGLHPPPDLGTWVRVADPAARLVRGLTELYRYWAEIEPMAGAVLRDHRVAPDRVGTGLVSFMDRCREILAQGWPSDGVAARDLRAAVGHAVRFETWHSLVVDEGLPERAAVQIMAGMVLAARGQRPDRVKPTSARRGQVADVHSR
jgi:AcrR family transcriptional regulator